MAEKFWNCLTDYHYAEYYAQHQYRLWNRILTALRILAAMGSLSSVASWFIWREHPALWGTLTIACQLASIILPELPIAKQIDGLRYFTMELNLLNARMMTVWDAWFYQNIEPEAEALQAFTYEFIQMESRFLEGEYRTVSKKLDSKLMQAVRKTLARYTEGDASYTQADVSMGTGKPKAFPADSLS